MQIAYYDEDPLVDQIFVREILTKETYDAKARLHQQILTMFYIEGYSCSVIASKLRMTIAGVEGAITEAVKQIRWKLAQHNGLLDDTFIYYPADLGRNSH